MKKRQLKLIIAAFLICFALSAGSAVVYANDIKPDSENSLDVSELIDNLDLSSLDEYLAGLQSYSGDIVGASAGEYIKALISGEKKFDFQVIVNIMSMSFLKSKNTLSIISVLIAMCVIWSLVSGIEFKNNTNSAKKAVNIACLSIMSVIIIYWIYTIISGAADYFDDVKKLCDAVFPIFFTLLTAGGAAGSAAALSPAAAIMSVTLISFIKTIVFPMAIAMLALAVVGNLSDEMALGSLGNLIENACNWIMKTGFYVFAAFLGTQGLFTGINDSISLRLGKFALSKYVPLIGGYLSDGFNYVIAGSIIIKNALGVTSVLLVFIRFFPVFLSLLIASLSLKVIAAIAEPLGIQTAVSVLSKIEGSIKIIRAAVIGTTFLFIIFIGAVMTCGSSVI